MARLIEMHSCDRRHVVEKLPRDIRDLLTKYARRLYVAGGFVRSVIAGEEVSDIDMFGEDKEEIEKIAEEFHKSRAGSTIHKSENAITVLTPNRLPVQFITRWTFSNYHALVNSFDFTVCQAAIWRTANAVNAEWGSRCSERFYVDLAGKRLFYTNPVREEEAGGSMLRVLKYNKRGYSIQVDSLGQVIARMCDSKPDAMPWGAHFAEILREVDPLRVVDGLELSTEHHNRAEGRKYDEVRYSNDYMPALKEDQANK